MKNITMVISMLALAGTLAWAQDLPRFDKTPGDERKPGQVYVDEGGRKIYWPKGMVSAEDVYGGKINKTHQPRRGYTEDDLITEGFAYDRLGPVPEPGVHPRLFITPRDLQRIRDHVAAGEEAPLRFRQLWRGVLEQGGITRKGEPHEFKPAPFTRVGYSMVNNFIRQILYAQVTNDDELGRALAKNLYEASVRDHKVLDLFDQNPQRDNVWVVTDTRWLPDGHEYKKYGQWYWPVYPEAYDYAWRWLTEEERASVRGVIARLQADRYTHFMELPSSRHLINHASMAMFWMAYPMVIEGEEGYSRKHYEFAREKYQEALEYYISPKGVMYENVKGFLPWNVYLAIARRENGEVLRHAHVFEHMRQIFFTASNIQNCYAFWARPPVRTRNRLADEFWDARNPESRTWQIQPSGHPHTFVSIMNWFYPGRKDFDFVYKAFFHTQNMDFYLKPEYNTWIRDIEFPAILVAFATDGVLDEAGNPVDWNKTEVDFEPETAMVDLERGVARFRSDWNRDALRVDQECRSDFYTGGHESPEFGHFLFAADGVEWVPKMGAYGSGVNRNVVTVDGKSGAYPPVAGRFVAMEDTPETTTTIVDYSAGLQFKQQQRNELILHPKLKIPFHHWMRGFYGWEKDRSWQAAFLPHHRWFEEYLASTDFGHWDGQNTGGAWYERILPEVSYAWRTLQLVKGERPFMLCLDDVKLGDETHSFRWNLNLNTDIILIKQPSANEMIFGRYDIPGDRAKGSNRYKGNHYVRYIPQRPHGDKAGEPLLYVRVLNRNTEDEYPQPGYENAVERPRVAIPARTVDPSYKDACVKTPSQAAG